MHRIGAKVRLNAVAPWQRSDEQPDSGVHGNKASSQYHLWNAHHTSYQKGGIELWIRYLLHFKPES